MSYINSASSAISGQGETVALAALAGKLAVTTPQDPNSFLLPDVIQLPLSVHTP